MNIFTPQLWQTVILRNYGLASNKALAKVLNCSQKTIKKEAKRLGIESIKHDPIWLKKSYLTIIRNNWNILPNNQIKLLLNMTDKQFDYELKENDFLYVKLGKKAKLENVYYSPLNESEIQLTNKIQKIVKKNIIKEYKKPFDFHFLSSLEKTTNSNKFIIYPYDAPYSDPFLNSSELISQNQLKTLQNQGITGIWIQGIISKLAPYPFTINQDNEYKIRLKNLMLFIKKCKNYKIGVYLYFNEPRSIKLNDVKKEYLHLIGRIENDEVALCISQNEVQDYLLNSIKYILTHLKDLDGIITITSSENLTHCKHILGSECKKCESYKPYELAVMINNIFQKAINETNAKTQLIANLWGWAPYCGYTKEDVKNGIKMLDPRITLMFVSEFGTHVDNELKYTIGEYSISHGEPCTETIENIKYAKSLGRDVMAKIQVNNCWEIATVPYYPTFELIINHLKKLKELDVKDYMLSWTLGGYPSILINLVNSFNNSFNYDLWLKKYYGKNANEIKNACHYFSTSFKNYPHNLNVLYYSPIQIGPINPFYKEKNNLKATMVTFPYDDYSSWVKSEKDIESFKSIIKQWESGLKILNKIKNKNVFINELDDVAKTIYINMSSFVNQYEYYSNNISIDVFKAREIKYTKQLYLIASNNSTIGFEASNQYLFTQNLFLEKIISLNK